ncbi:hypothetical protein DAI22_10g092101 [Oryza sativa Japonica Group]|nr:hypothetical protein DAI22_10g092101 [Oryza sativa Japonica Group]
MRVLQAHIYDKVWVARIGKHQEMKINHSFGKTLDVHGLFGKHCRNHERWDYLGATSLLHIQ